jgi:hypothetical protein
MIWAENMLTPDYTKKHTYYGSFLTTVNADGTTVLIVEKAESKANTIAIWHGIMMWLCWTVFGFIMVSTNRWYSYKSDVSQYVHGATGIVILGLTIGFVAGMTN